MNAIETQPHPRRRRVIPVQIMLSPEQIAELDLHTERNAETRSVIVRRAIRVFLEQNKAQEVSHV
jgi:metal-responsive CopG/Arc/MetJ family transcriptional regulator